MPIESERTEERKKELHIGGVKVGRIAGAVILQISGEGNDEAANAIFPSDTARKIAETLVRMAQAVESEGVS